MQYIFIQPTVVRFVWELEVSILRMLKLGVSKENITILLDDKNPHHAMRLENLGCEVCCFTDDRPDKLYIASFKPYFWYKYLAADKSREKEDYFYLDSDVLLLDLPKVQPQEGTWYTSDCNSYLGHTYIDSKGEGLLEGMADIVGIDPELVRSIDVAGGAQWVISKPTASFWHKVYDDSCKLYRYLDSIENEYIKKNSEDYVPIQKWTAEMWSQLWNTYLAGIDVQVHDDLRFVFGTDSLEAALKVKIIHNAGVTEKMKDTLFYKADYRQVEPYGMDFSYVDKDSASYAYIQGIKEVEAMAQYKVIQGFRDKTDGKAYFVGDKFPKPASKKITAKRYKELVDLKLLEKVEE